MEYKIGYNALCEDIDIDIGNPEVMADLLISNIFKVKGQGNKSTVFVTLDTETSQTEHDSVPVCFLYTWQISTSLGGFHLGRTLDSLVAFINNLDARLKLEKTSAVIYVHNLMYEYSFLFGSLDKAKIHDQMWVESWKVLKFSYGNLEFRDSYLLFNDSLKNATKEVLHSKKSGEDFDYNKIRHSNTELTEDEIEYCKNDVLGLAEAINKRMIDYAIDGKPYTVNNIPLTSTGFVRAEMKNNLPLTKIEGEHPSFETLTQLEYTFRGGNTHANRYKSGVELDNVVSYDRSSSYPDCIVNRPFPITEFVNDTVNLQDINTRNNEILNSLDYKSLVGQKTYIFKLTVSNLIIKDNVTVPYISMSNMVAVDGVLSASEIDNGRVLSNDGVFAMYLTDFDYTIIANQYDFDIVSVDCVKSSVLGYLPKYITALVNKYYTGKTALKGVEGAENEYNKSKALLNSIYGMMATKQNKVSILFDMESGRFTQDRESCNEANYNKKYEQSLKKREKGKPEFHIPYQYGVYTTVWARLALQYGIDACGDAFVYCDTDSIKAVESELPSDFESKMKYFNDVSIRDSTENGATAKTPKGVSKYMGVFEKECVYEEFITYGAKKYCYKDGNELHPVVSGVGKFNVVDGSKTVKQLSSIHDFNAREQFVFKNCKHTPIHCMIPTGTEIQVTDYLGKSETVTINTYTALIPTDYTLSLEKGYRTLLDDLMEVYNECKTENKPIVNNL